MFDDLVRTEGSPDKTRSRTVKRLQAEIKSRIAQEVGIRIESVEQVIDSVRSLSSPAQ
ncbi:MAG: hypothetical protein IPJ30_04605 [Acidobacteria bacterium]|nr:hypothetical protein [Acidobacteriota bacterium]